MVGILTISVNVVEVPVVVKFSVAGELSDTTSVDCSEGEDVCSVLMKVLLNKLLVCAGVDIERLDGVT